MPEPAAPPPNQRMMIARCEDGVDLQGLLMAPADRPRGDLLCIWVHTRQLGFAEPEYLWIGEAAAHAGLPFLTVNTRGHGFGSWFRTGDGPLLGGSAWEVFTDCVHDLDAWVETARQHGFRRLILAGHGFGGAKIVHYQAQRGRREVAGLVLASSASSVRPKMSDEASDLARRMRDEGRGRDLMPWGTGGDSLASTVSADWYLDRERMNRELYGQGRLPPALARIRCPIVAFFGTSEGRPGREPRDYLERIARTATASARVETALIEGADFFYTGAEARIAAALLGARETFGVPARAA